MPLAKLLPHLGRTLRGKDPVPRLSVVVLPKATTRVGRLSAGDKAMLLQSQHRWTGGKTIHSEDLPWLLGDWLPTGCLGVPADAQSGSQDMFFRLSGGRGGLRAEARECHSWARNGVDCETSSKRRPPCRQLLVCPTRSFSGAYTCRGSCAWPSGDADAEVFEPGGAWMLLLVVR